MIIASTINNNQVRLDGVVYKTKPLYVSSSMVVLWNSCSINFPQLSKWAVANSHVSNANWPAFPWEHGPIETTEIFNFIRYSSVVYGCKLTSPTPDKQKFGGN